MTSWVQHVGGCDALTVAGGLLVVATPSSVSAFESKSGQFRWTADIESEGGSTLVIEEGEVLCWAARQRVRLRSSDGEVLGNLDRENRPRQVGGMTARAGDYQLVNGLNGLTVVAGSGETWEVRVPEPQYDESTVVTEGDWAWLVLSDGRLFGIDFGSESIMGDLANLSRLKPRASSSSSSSSVLAIEFAPPPPLSPRYVPALAWTGTEILVWGGLGVSPVKSLTDGAAFDPESRKWRRLPPSQRPPARRESFIWTGDELLVFGGYAASEYPEGADPTGAAYNPSTDTWRMIAAAPFGGRCDAAVGGTGTALVVGGHRGNFVGMDDAWEYLPAADKWRPAPAPPIPGRSGAVSVTVNGDQLVWGGMHRDVVDGPTTYLADGAVFLARSGSWHVLPAAPLKGRSGHALVETGRGVMVLGGERRARATRDCAILAGDWSGWTKTATPRFSLSQAQAVRVGDHIVCFGGNAPAPNLGIYSVEYDRWSTVGDELDFWPGSGARGVSLADDIVYIWSGFERNAGPLSILRPQ